MPTEREVVGLTHTQGLYWYCWLLTQQLAQLMDTYCLPVRRLAHRIGIGSKDDHHSRSLISQTGWPLIEWGDTILNKHFTFTFLYLHRSYSIPLKHHVQYIMFLHIRIINFSAAYFWYISYLLSDQKQYCWLVESIWFRLILVNL